MRILFIFVLAMGIGLAGFAVYIVSSQFAEYDAALAAQREQAQNVVQVPLAPVVVANRELPYGRILAPDDLKIIQWPEEHRPEGIFAAAEDIFVQDGDRRIVLRQIDENEPITVSKITGFGLEAGMAARLTEGMRAFTIRVDVASGVSGFLSSGDRVDVFWTGRDGRDSVTRLIIENLRLIAIDQSANEDASRPIIARTITVEASPQQAAILAQAGSSGKLTLSLRGLSDTARRGIVEVDQDDIIGRVEEPEPVIAPEPEVVAPAPQRTIIIRRAGAVSGQVSVDQEN